MFASVEIFQNVFFSSQYQDFLALQLSATRMCETRFPTTMPQLLDFHQ
jgi:hypothetical protein